jgi:hypothetical protein
MPLRLPACQGCTAGPPATPSKLCSARSRGSLPVCQGPSRPSPASSHRRSADCSIWPELPVAAVLQQTNGESDLSKLLLNMSLKGVSNF